MHVADAVGRGCLPTVVLETSCPVRCRVPPACWPCFGGRGHVWGWGSSLWALDSPPSQAARLFVLWFVGLSVGLGLAGWLLGSCVGLRLTCAFVAQVTLQPPSGGLLGVACLVGSSVRWWSVGPLLGCPSVVRSSVRVGPSVGPVVGRLAVRWSLAVRRLGVVVWLVGSGRWEGPCGVCGACVCCVRVFACVRACVRPCVVGCVRLVVGASRPCVWWVVRGVSGVCVPPACGGSRACVCVCVWCVCVCSVSLLPLELPGRARSWRSAKQGRRHRLGWGIWGVVFVG